MNSAVGFDTDKWGLKTVRFLGSKIDPEDDLGWLNDANIYGAYNCDISNPDSLTNFINWAAKVCPAKNYVLIISDHGGSYMPHDDLPYVPALGWSRWIEVNKQKPCQTTPVDWDPEFFQEVIDNIDL